MSTHKILVSAAFGTLLLAPLGSAQGQEIRIAPKGELRYTIESSTKTETDRKILVNGEEPNFGGGGGRFGAAGPMTATQKVVFVEGEGWRQYEAAEAKASVAGEDGDDQEATVTGELSGIKLDLTGTAPAAMTTDEGDSPLNQRSLRGVPGRIDLSALAPSDAIDVGDTYDVGAGLRSALASLSHPIRPKVDRPAGGGDESGADRPRGQRARGEGGAGGGRAQGGRGQGGRGGRGPGQMLGAQAGENSALRSLLAEGVKIQAEGKLESVENGIARIAIRGTATGEGNPATLGLAAGMGFGGRGMGGRGGRGGRNQDQNQGQDEGESSGSVNIEVSGVLLVDLARQCATSLTLGGKLKSKSHTARTMNRGGEDMDMETDVSTNGTFSVSVACEPSK